MPCGESLARRVSVSRDEGPEQDYASDTRISKTVQAFLATLRLSVGVERSSISACRKAHEPLAHRRYMAA